MITLRIGQFSRSPVLGAARHLGWDRDLGLDLQVGPVPSSPAQFAALREREIDVALTSPDNVLLYASTDRNPLGQQLPLRIRRAIDGGLGLALVCRPEIETGEQLTRQPVAVDVLPSGFAMLLKALLRQHGVDEDQCEFIEAGATPKRAERLIEGSIGCTILNAESRVRAESAGMRSWASSEAVSPLYPGTVLATLTESPDISALLELWDRTTQWLLDAPDDEVRAALVAHAPELGSREYLDLMRSPTVGLQRNPAVSIEQLQILADLRKSCSAWAPETAQMRSLAMR